MLIYGKCTVGVYFYSRLGATLARTRIFLLRALSALQVRCCKKEDDPGAVRLAECEAGPLAPHS